MRVVLFFNFFTTTVSDYETGMIILIIKGAIYRQEK